MHNKTVIGTFFASLRFGVAAPLYPQTNRTVTLRKSKKVEIIASPNRARLIDLVVLGLAGRNSKTKITCFTVNFEAQSQLFTRILKSCLVKL